jgi:hypothetical protein
MRVPMGEIVDLGHLRFWDAPCDDSKAATHQPAKLDSMTSSEPRMTRPKDIRVRRTSDSTSTFLPVRPSRIARHQVAGLSSRAFPSQKSASDTLVIPRWSSATSRRCGAWSLSKVSRTDPFPPGEFQRHGT